MAGDHPTTDPDEDEYGKVSTETQSERKPASERVESEEFAHADDHD